MLHFFCHSTNAAKLEINLTINHIISRCENFKILFTNQQNLSIQKEMECIWPFLISLLLIALDPLPYSNNHHASYHHAREQKLLITKMTKYPYFSHSISDIFTNLAILLFHPYGAMNSNENRKGIYWLDRWMVCRHTSKVAYSGPLNEKPWSKIATLYSP